MTSEGSTSDDRQRIEELEQEVARLRTRLDEEGAAGDPGPDHDRDDDAGAAIAGADADAAGVDKIPMPNRTRVIVIAALAGLLALIVVVSLVVGMSRVIAPFSRSAAKAISPWEPGDVPETTPDPEAPDPGWTTTTPTPRPAPKPPPDNLPRAPGL